MRQQERADRRAEKVQRRGEGELHHLITQIAAVVGAASSSSAAPGGTVFRGVREDDGLEEAMVGG